MVNRARQAPRTAAEQLAISALSFIASDMDRLGAFLAATGMGPQDVRIAAREPLFLAGVLDHLANNERILLAFAAETGTPAEAILQARETLAGRTWMRDLP